MKSRTIGIDFGLARIGIAISDEMHIIASPLHTIKAEKKSEKTVLKVISEIERYKTEYGSEIDTIVIGLPLMMDGSVGHIADEVKHFVELLKLQTDIPIVTWDERLTTVQAERSLRETQMTRKKRSKVVDAVAAVIILQNYLDAKNF